MSHCVNQKSEESEKNAPLNPGKMNKRPQRTEINTNRTTSVRVEKKKRNKCLLPSHKEEFKIIGNNL